MSEGAELESDLPDLSATDLHLVTATPSAVLDNCVRRMLAQAKELPDQYVAFQNAV
ncbi:FXSXX-COOH protein [Kibdelosporangium banguiense]|uniref:FXSXX-COOH protein n=1 Tax=Kibdelosporangium banguiense TaxID=1365924 RepID=A0ABS4TQV7_9PSEU|nr:hypothetical protein [Kibdelosporangium banguiense]MBP2326288.1 FXSXX-COOH protein [Kibdelosporangium banguiense]